MHESQKQIAFDVNTLVNECQPESILAIGDGADSYTSEYVAQRQIINRVCSVTQVPASAVLPDLSRTERFDVGIVVNTLEYLDQDYGGQLIARLRDLHTARFVAVIRMGDQWHKNRSFWQTGDLLGYGMKLVSRYKLDAKPIHVYKYDIMTYKKTPEWLNSRNWANPKLWDRFRW